MGKSILVVDDSSTARTQARLVLEQAGFEVDEAVDGLDALEHIEEKSYDGVVCDVTMPRMDGVAFVENVLRVKGLKLAILMVTSERSPELMRGAIDAGAKCWLIKPVRGDQIVSAVTRLVAD